MLEETPQRDPLPPLPREPDDPARPVIPVPPLPNGELCTPGRPTDEETPPAPSAGPREAVGADLALPPTETFRLVDGNDQTAPWSEGENLERAFVAVQAPSPDTTLRWSYGIDAGGGDDVIYLQSGSRGIVRGGPGADTFVIAPGSFVSFWLSGFDPAEDRIVIDAPPGSVTVESFFTPIDSVLDIDGDDFFARLTFSGQSGAGAARGAVVFADADVPEVPTGLIDIGDALAEPFEVPARSAFASPDTALGPGPQTAVAGGAEPVSLDVGFGPDQVLITGTAGGFVSTGFTDFVPPSFVRGPNGELIQVGAGSSSQPDGARDVVILTPEARGEWRLGADPADRIVLSGFRDIAALEDLQRRAFETETTSIRYELTPDLTLLTPLDAGAFLLRPGRIDRTGSPEADRMAGGPQADALRGGIGDDTLIGRAGSDTLRGAEGDDTLVGGSGDDTLIGGTGRDSAVYALGLDAVAVETEAGRPAQVRAGAEGVDTLDSVERLVLADGVLVFDLDAGPAVVDLTYRLYAAALARTPDEAGLRFWVDAIAGGLTEREAAVAFSDNPEFDARFGGGDGVDDCAFVHALYDNVLGRAPDEAGLDFWLDVFGSGERDRAGMLAEFAASAENVERTRPFLEDGAFVLGDDLAGLL